MTRLAASSHSSGNSASSTSEDLIRAAKRLFASQGFDGTTVRDIADAAKTNLSLVSYYFKGKEGLYRGH